jgi:tripartite-type tricarboxylate transporter receptor subunit TctC
MVNMASAIGAVKVGQVKAYSVTTPKRVAVLPDVPTLAEGGLPDIHYGANWNGMFAPARTPGPIIDKLFAAMAAVMKEPAMQEALVQRMYLPESSASPAAFNAYVQSDTQRWEKIIKDNNVKLD